MCRHIHLFSLECPWKFWHSWVGFATCMYTTRLQTFMTLARLTNVPARSRTSPCPSRSGVCCGKGNQVAVIVVNQVPALPWDLSPYNICHGTNVRILEVSWHIKGADGPWAPLSKWPLAAWPCCHGRCITPKSVKDSRETGRGMQCMARNLHRLRQGQGSACIL